MSMNCGPKDMVDHKGMRYLGFEDVSTKKKDAKYLQKNMFVEIFDLHKLFMNKCI